MEKGLLIFLFLVARFLFSAYKKSKQKQAPQPSTSSETTKPKGLDDILGDFMKELEKKNSKKNVPKAVPVFTNTDKHKAEDDSHKEIDWQNINRTKIESKEQLLKHSDYKNISYHNENVSQIKTSEEESEDFSLDFEEINLRKAIIYKEILDRKYFTV